MAEDQIAMQFMPREHGLEFPEVAGTYDDNVIYNRHFMRQASRLILGLYQTHNDGGINLWPLLEGESPFP